MKKIFGLLQYAFLLLLIALVLLVFLPKHYEVPPFHIRESTQYWNLNTGSKIGYTLVPAKGVKKPYPIVYVHGGPGGFIYDNNIKMLTPLSEDGYDIYLYDQIGAGHSDRLDNITEYTVERHKLDLEAIAQQIGSKKIILIGQSWGAILATFFAADHLDKVEKLILTGPGPIFPINQDFMALKPPDSLHIRAPLVTNSQGNDKMNSLRTKTVALWAEIFGTKLASDKEMDNFQSLLSRELNKSIVCDTAKASKTLVAGSGYYAQIMTMRSLNEYEHDIRSVLKGTTIPLYIMRGQCDNQKWGAAQEYLTIFQKHRLVVIPDAGHSISIEQPELYLRTMRAFLKEGEH